MGLGTQELSSQYGNLIDVDRIMDDLQLAADLRRHRVEALAKELFHLLCGRIEALAPRHGIALTRELMTRWVGGVCV